MLNSTLGGYNGKVLRVNLTECTAATENIDVSFCRKYLGGAGFVLLPFAGDQVCNRPIEPSEYPGIRSGPLTGIALPGSGRHCVGRFHR